MLKRLFDIICSAIGLTLVSPIFVVLAIWIKFDSPGPVFYRQVRVGRGNRDFRIFKFRSMRVGADKGSLITVGGRDPRITRSGYIIRQFKFDELPQLINVFLGDMSFVGPRPEVRHYVDMYTPEQLHVLDVRPGITDLASIKYRNENELLAKAEDPEEYYIKVIMPDKLALNLDYVAKSSFWCDIKMIFLTIWSLSVVKAVYAFFHWYFGKDALPYWFVLITDCFLLICFYFFGYFCVLGSLGVVDYFWLKLVMLLVCLVPYLICYKVFHTYTNIVRYSSFVDLQNILFANAIGSAVILLARYCFFAYNDNIFPGIRVVLFAFAFATMAMCAWRIIVKALFDIVNLRGDKEAVFIYGAGLGAVSLAKSIRNEKQTKFVVRGFIDPTGEMRSRFIGSIQVYPDNTSLITQLQSQKIKAILVSPMRVDDFRSNDRLVSELTESGIQIYMVPDAQEWDGKSAVNQEMLKEVNIENLLPRNKIEVNLVAIGRLLKDRCILITGAAGSIGSEMVHQIAQFNPKSMILIDQAETPMHDVRLFMARNYPSIDCQTIVTSITNQVRMEQIFAQYKPEYVFHAAAYKHVPMMEDNPSEAVQNNIHGTRIVADLAVKYGARKFVMISTDKAVNPTNVMGCSKRICEIYVQSLDAAIKEGKVKGETQFVTTRFGNVLGSNGSVIPIFKEQIQRGGPVTVTHPEIIRYFMLIPEACRLVLEAGAFGRGGEIFVFDMGNPVKIADLAKRMIALSGAKNIKIEFTGLRPGEKLFEEVLNESESTIPTHHKKIRIAKVREYDYSEAVRNEERLYDASFHLDDMGIVSIMKEIVPEFKSKHSKYEVLDK